jgi:hypothetical protein
MHNFTLVATELLTHVEQEVDRSKIDTIVPFATLGGMVVFYSIFCYLDNCVRQDGLEKQKLLNDQDLNDQNNIDMTD